MLAAIQPQAPYADGYYSDDLNPPLEKSEFSFDVLNAGIARAGSIPLVIINELILIRLNEPHSDLRYNNSYPRWIYDDYRTLMSAEAAARGWDNLDRWDSLPPDEFSPDADLHPSASGELDLAAHLSAPLLDRVRP